MLSRRDLERLAPTLTHGNVGHAQTLYLQDIVLATVSRSTVDQLVFKGGTALMKFYQLDRFSEDLDFTASGSIAFESVIDAACRDLENYGADVAERTTGESETGLDARLGIEGPLFTGDRRSLCFLQIHANKGSTTSRIRDHRYTPQFPDIPSFDLPVLDETEILAEKIRALLTRRQPRDLYDTYHLLRKSVPLERDLVQEKLDYYEMEYDPASVLEAARDLESGWETLEALTYSELPGFDEALGALEEALPGAP